MGATLVVPNFSVAAPLGGPRALRSGEAAFSKGTVLLERKDFWEDEAGPGDDVVASLADRRVTVALGVAVGLGVGVVLCLEATVLTGVFFSVVAGGAAEGGFSSAGSSLAILAGGCVSVEDALAVAATEAAAAAAALFWALRICSTLLSNDTFCLRKPKTREKGESTSAAER